MFLLCARPKPEAGKPALPVPAVQELEAAWGPLMVYLGYELRFLAKSGCLRFAGSRDHFERTFPMMYSVKKLWKNAMGMDIAGRTLAVRADDTFIISYPRSGNTWTRFLIANLTHPEEPVTFANIERLIPDAEAQSSRYMRGIPSPRMVKSHSYFDPRYPKVIYIVRDPRDVALSYYDFSRKYRQIED